MPPSTRTRTLRKSYDVVIIGGAMTGSAIAWWLKRNPAFDGHVLVVERDFTYQMAATSHSNSCIRQQFSNEINIQISQFGAEFINNFRAFMGNDARVPKLQIHNFGYLYLAANTRQKAVLESMQAVQRDCGAATRHMTSEEIAAQYHFYNLDDIVAGNHNTIDEGYFDGNTIFQWFQRQAREMGAEFIENEAVALTCSPDCRRVEFVRLKSGEEISCGHLVNAAGTRGAEIAAMAGIVLPVEARKRYTFVFEAEKRLSRDLPLTIDPSGIHVRTDGQYYMAGCAGHEDGAVSPDDFLFDHSVFEEKVWPLLAHRIPQFEAIRLKNSWVGHYDYMSLDQNAVLGPHPEIGNFIFANGFSGHGLQQAPAIGRGLAEIIVHGGYRTLDLSPFSFARVMENRPFTELAII